jgi:hypothetical protein
LYLHDINIKNPFLCLQPLALSINITSWHDGCMMVYVVCEVATDLAFQPMQERVGVNVVDLGLGSPPKRGRKGRILLKEIKKRARREGPRVTALTSRPTPTVATFCVKIDLRPLLALTPERPRIECSWLRRALSPAFASSSLSLAGWLDGYMVSITVHCWSLIKSRDCTSLRTFTVNIPLGPSRNA